MVNDPSKKCTRNAGLKCQINQKQQLNVILLVIERHIIEFHGILSETTFKISFVCYFSPFKISKLSLGFLMYLNIYILGDFYNSVLKWKIKKRVIRDKKIDLEVILSFHNPYGHVRV